MIWEKAIYRPIKANFLPKDDIRCKNLKKPDGLIIHWTGTTESVAQVWSYFDMSLKERQKRNQGKKVVASSAHFVVDRDGTAIQMIDTESMAFSVDGFKYDGLRVSVEVIATPKNPLFTEDQIYTCGRLLGWLNDNFQTPIRLAQSKEDSGLSYHRMYAATACPGTENIKNLGQIIEVARQATQPVMPEIGNIFD